MKLALGAAVAALILLGCDAPAKESAAPPTITPTATETATPTPTATPEPPTPTPTPEIVATPTRSVQIPESPVQAVSNPSDGIPWYVPARWHEAYLACLSDPARYAFWDFLWERSYQAGYPNGWDYNEATRLINSEGGNDLCQFNTAGSGACGPPQLLTCPGLDLASQQEGMWAKYVDGGYSFYRHWWQWHGR